MNSGGAGDASGTTYNGSASRTLSYNTIGAAASANFKVLGANVNYDVNRSIKTSGGGLAIYSGYSTGTNRPTTYDVSAQFAATNDIAFEIAADWLSGSGPTLYARSLRDCCQDWSSWVTILTSLNYNSYSPTLTGGGASGTWGINITGNAETVDGFSASQSTIANGIVVRDPSGYIFGSYINMTDDGNPGGGTSITSFITKQGDNYYRSVSPTNAMVSIRGVASGTWGINISGNAATSDRVNEVSETNLNTAFTNTPAGQLSWTENYNQTNAPTPNTYYNTISMRHSNPSNVYGNQLAIRWVDSEPNTYVRVVNNGSFGPWRTILADFNYNSYAPTLTGGGASGTWGINITGTAGSETLNTVTSRGATTSNAVTVGLLIAQGPGGNYNENVRLPGSTAVISFNTSGATGAGSYNIVSQTNFQIRNAVGTQVFVMDQSGNLTMTGNISGNYILGTYFNASLGNSENPTIGQIWTQNTTDNYLRKSTPAHFRSQITDGVYVYTRGQSNWNDSTVINNVVGLLAWKNYGNAHVIFDASQGTSPSGGGVSQTNATNAWSASYPTLMGWNGSQTYGVRVDSARVADSATLAPAYLPLAGGTLTGPLTIGTTVNSVIWNDGTGTYMENTGNSAATRVIRLQAHNGSFSYTQLFVNGGGGYVEVNNQMRAPIYYDSQDTTYYLDPNSTGLSLSSNGIVSSGVGTSGGFQNRVYTSGRNRIWSFGNADGYGISYFQGGPDYIGLHVSGSPTQAGSDFWVSSTGIAQASGSMRAPIFYDSNDTSYYVDPNSESNLYRFTAASMTRNAINYLSINSPFTTRAAQTRPYQNGTMGWGTVDFNAVFSNWGSGFIDTWSNPANAPGGSSHYVGFNAMHYNFENNSQGYGFQMACAGEAANRYFWRNGWPNLNGWVEMYHTGNFNPGSYLPLSGGTMTGAITTPTGTSMYIGGQNVTTSARLIINWHTDSDYNYLIGKRAGSWTQPMDISFYTGLRYHAHQAYNGHIFYVTGYDGTEAFSIGKGDANVRVVNNIYASSFFETSDKRLKELVQDNYSVEGIHLVKPKLYIKNGKEEVGYYAQDFQEILPVAIATELNGYLNLSYTQVHTVKIAHLEDSVEEIKAKILYLENQLKQKQ
jgi:hypothetical protein